MSGPSPQPVDGVAELLAPPAPEARLEALAERPSHGREGALLRRCVEALRGVGAAERRRVGAWSVPGRVEVLGKHTDYLGGPSLLIAAEQGFVLVAAPRDDGRIRVVDALSGERVEIDPAVERDFEPGAWGNYPATVARRLRRHLPSLPGLDLAFASDLPPAAGMSSSSALVTGTLLALGAAADAARSEALRGELRSREDLAELAAAVESGSAFRSLPGDRGVGTHGGSEDHTAILCARAGALVEYAFAPVRFRRAIPLPDGYRFAIGASGVRAEKTGAAMERYNRVARLGRLLEERWRSGGSAAEGSLADAIAADPGLAGRLERRVAEGAAGATGPELVERLRHFAGESREVIPEAADALSRGDVRTFGARVDRSHAMAERWLHNQIPETSALQRLAREEGAAAASAFGAGFGGAVWALVPGAGADAFLHRWRARYREAFPERESAAFFLTDAGAPARRIL